MNANDTSPKRKIFNRSSKRDLKNNIISANPIHSEIELLQKQIYFKYTKSKSPKIWWWKNTKHEATLPHRIQHVRHRASSITTDSKMASRSSRRSSIPRSSNHQKEKEKRKTVPRCAYILAKIMVSKRGPKEPGGTRWKNRSSAFAVRPRRWQHLTKRSRVADGGTRIDGRVFVVFPFLFFFPLWSYLSLPRAPATLFDRLSLARQGVPLFSRSWQIRLMRWTRWDMGQRIGVQCRHGRGVTVPWKRPCPGPQSRRELSAGWSPV